MIVQGDPESIDSVLVYVVRLFGVLLLGAAAALFWMSSPDGHYMGVRLVQSIGASGDPTLVFTYVSALLFLGGWLVLFGSYMGLVMSMMAYLVFGAALTVVVSLLPAAPLRYDFITTILLWPYALLDALHVFGR